MPQNPSPAEEYRYDDDDISLAELVQKGKEWADIIWGERRFVAKVVGVSIVFGLILAFGSKPEYSASTRILPYRAAGGGSGLSGLAGFAGVRLPAGAADQAIGSELYPEVATTFDFLAEIAETPIRFSSLPEPVTPIRYFREIAQPSVVDYLTSYTIGLPGKIIGAFRMLISHEKAEPTPELQAGPPIKVYNQAHRSTVREVGERLVTEMNKKTSIITITGTMPDRFAAADLVRTASDHLMARIIHYESKKAAEQVKFLEEQAEAAKVRLNRTQQSQAILTDRMRGTVSATATLESARLNTEQSLAFQLYSRFATELDQMRVKQSQDTPVFTILEQVVVPNRTTSPNRPRILAVALILGIVAAVAVVAVRRTMSGA
jgi:capsular polysaccharide biosynthesis protein